MSPDVMPDLGWLGPPVDVRGRFGPERRALVELLEGLAEEQWQCEAVPGWTVADLASHVLGDDVGRLARDRDGHLGGPAPRPGEDLPAFIDRINEEWVRAWRRASPRQVTAMLATTGADVSALWDGGLPDLATLPVSWAGADPSPGWLDAARDLTEYWVHRQQIRLAVGLPVDDGLLGVVVDTFMRALPHTYRDQVREVGTAVLVTVGGDDGVLGRWRLVRQAQRWSLHEAEVALDGCRTAPLRPAADAAAHVRLDPDTVWRLGTRMLSPHEAETRAVLTGDRGLARTALQLLAVVRAST